jgi:hypothetical protein
MSYCWGMNEQSKGDFSYFSRCRWSRNSGTSRRKIRIQDIAGLRCLRVGQAAIRLLVAALLVVSCLRATAATYYLSPSGNDSNPGTLAQPWATLYGSLPNLVAGDTLIQNPGLYSEFVHNLDTASDGATNAPITVIGLPGSVNQGSGIFVKNSNWIFSGFTISNFQFAAHMLGGFVIGAKANNTFIHDCVLRDFTTDQSQYGVVWYPDPAVIGPNTNFIPESLACNCVISNCLFTNFFGAEIIRVGGTNNLIVNNQIKHFLSSDCFQFFGAYNIIRGNYVTNAELVAGGQHPDLFQTYGQNGNIPSADNPYFDSHDNLAENNQFWDCNISFGQMTVDVTNAIVNVSNFTERNNLFVRCGSTNGSISSHDIPGLKFINNTYLFCGTNQNSSGDVLGFAINAPVGLCPLTVNNTTWRGQAINTVIANCAFIGCGRSANNGWWEIDSGFGVPTNTWNFTTVNNFVVHWDGANWSKKNPNLQTNIKGICTDLDTYQVPADLNPGVDPKLAAIAVQRWASDLRPILGSPLIDSGTNITTLNQTDLEGTIRPENGQFDIGCFEFDPTLLVHLDFDEDLTVGKIMDTTGNGHDAWQFDPTNWISATPGVVGNAGLWKVVGTITNDPGMTYNLSQYAGITNLSNIQFLTNGTISVWVLWATNAERWDSILDCGYPIPYSWDPTVATNSWALHYGSPDLNLNPTGPVFKRFGNNLNDTNGVLISWTQPRDGSTWYQIAVAWNGIDNTIVGYQNGQPIQTNSLGAPYLRISGSPRLGVAPFSITPWLAVGAMQHDGTPQWGDDRYPNAGFFKGKMDDLRIYNRPLSAAEVQTVYNGKSFKVSQRPPSPSNLRVILGP